MASSLYPRKVLVGTSKSARTMRVLVTNELVISEEISMQKAYILMGPRQMLVITEFVITGFYYIYACKNNKMETTDIACDIVN